MTASSDTELEPLRFSVPANIIRRIGRESISNPIVAILELAKNAYDEDATKVEVSFQKVESSSGTIEIEDNGNGMTEEDLRSKWCALATDNKERHPVSARLKRRKIGEKGLARFAQECLAERVVMISKPKGQNWMYTAVVNWDDFLSPHRIWDVSIPLKRSRKDKNEHGLKLTLSGLRTRWDSTAVDGVRRNLQTIFNPLSPLRKFRVHFESPEFPPEGEPFKRGALRLAVFQFRARLARNSQVLYELTDFRRSKPTRRTWQKRISPGIRCGPVDFRLYFYYRDYTKYVPTPRDETYFGKVRDFLNRWHGIRVYRDRFRVMPYGELGNDWLGLDDLRVQASTYPGNDQVFGVLSIGRRTNPSLVDTATREALIENFALRDLLRFLRFSIDEFVSVKNHLEGRTRGKKPKTIARKRKTVVSEPLLQFGRKYPNIAYQDLENEVNACVKSDLPNAALLLSRKMVENLVFSLLRMKYRTEVDLRWNKHYRRPHDFVTLLRKLQLKKPDFSQDDQRLIDKLNSLAGTFRLEANSAAHDLYRWLEDSKGLSRYKIPVMVQLLLDLLS
jgi:hypothetical protein